MQICQVSAQLVRPERKLTRRHADMSLGRTVTVTTRLLVIARQFDSWWRHLWDIALHHDDGVDGDLDLVPHVLVFPHQLTEGALVATHHSTAVVHQRPLVDRRERFIIMVWTCNKMRNNFTQFMMVYVDCM